MLIAVGDTIQETDLGLGAGLAVRSERLPVPGPAAGAVGEELLAERLRVERALAETGGIVAKAADSLGLSRQALYRKMEKLGLTVERRVKS